MSTQHAAPCPETRELLARLDAAGVAYERVSLREALRSDLPMFTYRGDVDGR